MKHHRFYVAVPITDWTVPVTIPSLELLNQLKRVLRFLPGDEVTLFDGSGREYIAAIYEYHSESVSFKIIRAQKGVNKPLRETWLFAAVIKKDNFEWIVEKATELGVSHIVPIITARTEKKDLNLERLSKVSIESSEQSGRVSVPQIHSILKLAECIDTYSSLSSVVWEPTAQKFDKNDMDTIVSMYIGPEGGWTKEELDMFKEKGMTVRSLGPQILRAETAVVAALSQIVF